MNQNQKKINVVGQYSSAVLEEEVQLLLGELETNRVLHAAIVSSARCIARRAALEEALALIAEVDDGSEAFRQAVAAIRSRQSAGTQ